MKRHLFFSGLIGCLIVITVLYIFSRPGPDTTMDNDIPQQDTTTPGLNSDSTTKPLSIDTNTWEAWIDKWTEVAVRKCVALAAKEGWGFNDEELAEVHNIYRKIAVDLAEEEKQKSEAPPPLFENEIEVTFTPPPPDAPVFYDTTGKKHTGPQTVEALMASFHKPGVLDERYPPEQWIQMLLDRGLTIQNEAEYGEYMRIRGILTSIEDDPQSWTDNARRLGIPESDVAALQTAYLEKTIGFHQKLHNARRANHLVGDITLAGPNNDIVLPFYVDRKMTYVERSPDYGAVFMGESLTDTQRFDLLFRGIEPEGIEIIYLDEMGNILEEKPPPYDRKEFRKMYEEAGILPPLEDKGTPTTDGIDSFEDVHPAEHATSVADSRVERMPEAVQAEFEKFQQEVRQLENFANMSDAEITAELEKQLREQLLPELPTEEKLEGVLREMITPKPLTPERFEKALQTLQRHGPKEGLRKLAKDDPELAEYFLRNPQQASPESSRSRNVRESQKE